MKINYEDYLDEEDEYPRKKVRKFRDADKIVMHHPAKRVVRQKRKEKMQTREELSKKDEY